MAISNKMELYIKRSLDKAVRDATGLPTKIQYQGTHAGVAEEDDDEWAAVVVLSMQRTPSRSDDWVGDVLFQVSCFARFGEARTDAQIDAPWEYAAKTRAALEHQLVHVNAIGDGDANQGTLIVGEGAMAYLPARTTDERYSDVHGVAVTFRAVMGTE